MALSLPFWDPSTLGSTPKNLGPASLRVFHGVPMAAIGFPVDLIWFPIVLIWFAMVLIGFPMVLSGTLWL